jgi:hypothetical protein
MGQEILPAQLALALLGPSLADGQQPGQPREGLAVGRVAKQARRAVREIQPTAGQSPDLQVLGRRPGAHHAGQGVAVGDADGGQAQPFGGRHQFLGVRGPAKEREVAGGLKLGIGVRHQFLP